MNPLDSRTVGVTRRLFLSNQNPGERYCLEIHGVTFEELLGDPESALRFEPIKLYGGAPGPFNCGTWVPCEATPPDIIALLLRVAFGELEADGGRSGLAHRSAAIEPEHHQDQLALRTIERVQDTLVYLRRSADTAKAMGHSGIMHTLHQTIDMIQYALQKDQAAVGVSPPPKTTT